MCIQEGAPPSNLMNARRTLTFAHRSPRPPAPRAAHTFCMYLLLLVADGADYLFAVSQLLRLCLHLS